MKTAKVVFEEMKKRCQECSYNVECKKGNIVPTIQSSNYLEELHKLRNSKEYENDEPYVQKCFC